MLTLDAINSFDAKAFVAALGFLFEDSPWVAAETWPKRPFSSLDALLATLCETMYAAPVERQFALIRAHPDLAGKAAIRGNLTPASTHEQASAGLNQLTPEEFARFSHLNDAYRMRFGFPFVICVRENTKHSILEQFSARLPHSVNQEIDTALGEIAKIARLRLNDATEQTV